MKHTSFEWLHVEQHLTERLSSIPTHCHMSWRSHRKGRVFREEKTSQCVSCSRKVHVQKGIWHVLECSHHQKGGCKLGYRCAFKHTEQAGGEPRKRKNSVVVAKALDFTQTSKRSHFVQVKSKGCFSAWSGVAEKPVLRQLGQEAVSKFRLSRLDHSLGIIRQGGLNGRNQYALSYEEGCAEVTEEKSSKRTWNLLARKLATCTRKY